MSVRRRPLPKAQCYWAHCHAKATTDDHVPAQMFFFEGTGDNSLKANRFTVRSCEGHNNSFSEDEEYVAFMTYFNISNAPLAHEHVQKKLLNTLRKKINERLADRVADAIFAPKVRGSLFEAALDMDAFHRVAEKIARGLHYYLTGIRLDVGMSIIWGPDMVGGHALGRRVFRKLTAVTNEFPWTEGHSGHELVFRWGHAVDPANRFVAFKFRFAGGFELRAIIFSCWVNGLEDRPISFPHGQDQTLISDMATHVDMISSFGGKALADVRRAIGFHVEELEDVETRLQTW